LIIMALPGSLLAIFVLIYFFGFAKAKANTIHNTPHYYASRDYTPRDHTTTPRDTYTGPRGDAPAPQDHESSHNGAGITYHDNPLPDHYNTPDVGDTALCWLQMQAAVVVDLWTPKPARSIRRCCSLSWK
jgi:hypothetical protein